MNKRSRARASAPLLACACGAAFLASAAAWAYVPPSSYIVKTMASKRAGIKGARIRSIVTIMDGDKPGSVHFKETTYFNPLTSTLHVYAYDDRNQKLYSAERREDSATLADALLFWHDDLKIDNALVSRGIPVRTEDELLKMKDEDERRASEQEHLARLNSSIAWVIGPSQSSPAELWVEKDAFQPLRLVAGLRPESGASDVVELQFDSYKHYREFPFPKVITAIQKKTPLFRDEVQDVVLTLDAAEFRSTPVPGFTDSGNAASGSMRDLIQKYFEVLR